jgi:hypothetical protein
VSRDFRIIWGNYSVVPPVFEEIFNGFRVTLYKEKRQTVVDVLKGVPKGVVIKS